MIRGMTKAQLAEKAGTSRPYITQLELGDRATPSPGLLQKLCQALDVENERVFYVEPTLQELVSEMKAAEARERKAS